MLRRKLQQAAPAKSFKTPSHHTSRGSSWVASSNICVDSTAQPQWCSPVTSCDFCYFNISMSDRVLNLAWQVVCLLQADPTEEKSQKFPCSSQCSLRCFVFLCKRSCTVRQCKRWICCQICRPIRLHLHVKEAARIGIFGSGAKPVQQVQTLMSRAGSPMSYLLWQMRPRDSYMSWSRLKKWNVMKSQ